MARRSRKRGRKPSNRGKTVRHRRRKGSSKVRRGKRNLYGIDFKENVRRNVRRGKRGRQARTRRRGRRSIRGGKNTLMSQAKEEHSILDKIGQQYEETMVGLRAMVESQDAEEIAQSQRNLQKHEQMFG